MVRAIIHFLKLLNYVTLPSLGASLYHTLHNARLHSVPCDPSARQLGVAPDPARPAGSGRGLSAPFSIAYGIINPVSPVSSVDRALASGARCGRSSRPRGTQRRAAAAGSSPPCRCRLSALAVLRADWNGGEGTE